jgi:hypothetical protein
MNRQEFLNDAIRTIAQRSGIERPEFHLTSVSQDLAGVFIMQTTWPEGRLICEKIASAVAGFPKYPYASCVALLPDLVDEIIRAARSPESFATDSAAALTGIGPSAARALSVRAGFRETGS